MSSGTTTNDTSHNRSMDATIEGENAPSTSVGLKRKVGFMCHPDKSNVYMEDINIRRRRLLGEDPILSSDSESSDEDDDEDESSRKLRKRSRKKRRLHWSKSPDNAAKYTDWTIEVKHFPADATGAGEDAMVLDQLLQATEIATYSVHRSTLGVHSEYFERIFLSGYAETTHQKNSIELPTPRITLNHFESMLEFCYTGQIDLTTENVVSVIHLSDYLGIEDLRKKAQTHVREAIHQDIKRRRFLASSKEKNVLDSLDEYREKSAKVAIFYEAAKELGIDDLQRAIVHVCSKEPKLLIKDFKLAEMPDIQFWCRIWEARRIHPDQISVSKTIVRLWSENLAYFIESHSEIVDLQTFRELTHIDSLKFISPEVAILMMEQEHRLRLDNIEANEYLVDKGDKEDALTCLQSRCVEALYNSKNAGWQISSPSEVFRGQLRKLPAIVLESILLKTMEYERDRKSFPMPEVSGAGSEFVNGIYRMSGWFKNAMKFTRMGVYEGNRQQITMYRYEGEWWISIIPEHRDEPGDCDDIDFYSFEAMEDGSDSPLPPKNGWITCSGESPAPRIRYLMHDDRENEVPEEAT